MNTDQTRKAAMEAFNTTLENLDGAAFETLSFHAETIRTALQSQPVMVGELAEALEKCFNHLINDQRSWGVIDGADDEFPSVKCARQALEKYKEQRK